MREIKDNMEFRFNYMSEVIKICYGESVARSYAEKASKSLHVDNITIDRYIGDDLVEKGLKIDDLWNIPYCKDCVHSIKPLLESCIIKCGMPDSKNNGNVISSRSSCEYYNQKII